VTEPTSTCEVFIAHAGQHQGGFVDFLHARFQSRFPAVRVFSHATCSPYRGSRAMKEIHHTLQNAFVGKAGRMSGVLKSASNGSGYVHQI
jgi:sigma54-dependent transcription regulator